MKVLFCNIAYMNRYTGNIEEDIPQGGGAWVKEHQDAHEKWNFLNINGNCYGFVMNKGDQFHIERLENTSRNAQSTSNAIVIWCAHKPGGETVIIGWYENATIYRYYQRCSFSPFGLDRDFFVEAKAEDCYLLPEDKRTYIIGRASEQGIGKGFGQSNFWYADSEYAKNEFIPSVLKYLQAHKNNRINILNDAYLEPQNIDIPLTAEEEKLADQFYADNEFLRFLPLGYRSFHHNPTADNAYDIATALRFTYQFTLAIEWYKKVIEIEGESWETCAVLPYLLSECEQFEEAITAATHLLSFEESNTPDAKHEIYSTLADNYMYLGNMDEAISWLDKILAESSDRNLIEHTKYVRQVWSNQ